MARGRENIVSTKSVELPFGYEKFGTVEYQAEISKFKGRAQRDVARLAKKSSPDATEILEAALRPSLVGVGGEKTSGALLGSLSLADRDALMFDVVRFTRGDIVPITQRCPRPGCDGVTTYDEFDLSTLPVTKLPRDAGVWWNGERTASQSEVDSLPPDEQKKFRVRVFSVEDEKLGVKALFRFPKGNDHRKIGKMAEREVEAIWTLMSCTCIRWSSPGVDHEAGKGNLPVSFWADLDLDVVELAQAEYTEAMPGIDSRVEFECSSCGNEFRAPVRALDFLFQGSDKRK